jgi:hypothetical protein
MDDMWLELRPLDAGRAEIVLMPVGLVISGPADAMRKTIAASGEQLSLVWYDMTIDHPPLAA